MTSAARTSKGLARAGFTLLEMVLVLVAIAVLGGGAITVMILSSDERALGDATSEVEALAKRARTIATLQQRPYALEFRENQVHLMPLAEALMEPDRREGVAEALEAGAKLEGSRFSSERQSWAAEEGMQISVRRWASEEFLPTNGKVRQIWRFDPEGPCEPITIHFQMEKSWAEAEFNPLTAAIRDLTQEIY